MFNRFIKIVWSCLAASLLSGFVFYKENSSKLSIYTNATIIMCVVWVVNRIISEGLFAALDIAFKNEKKDE